MTAAIVHYPCGCRMSVRGDEVVNWQQCPKGHPGTLRNDMWRKIEGRAHTGAERGTCKDPRCRAAAKSAARAPRWVQRKPPQENDE